MAPGGAVRVRSEHGYGCRVAAIVTVAAALACGVSGLSAATVDTITVGLASSGSQRSMHRGDLLVVRLPSNPSTGYTWTSRSGTRPALVSKNRTYVPPKDGHRLGAPGTAVLRYQAVAAGRTVIRLAYVRPWEKGVAPTRTFTLSVRVL
jgi:inhibitor of cysteine peptidase